MNANLTLACALSSEERVARKAGARAARVGLRAMLGPPPGQIVSFGLAGALVPGIEPGTVVTADRIVDSNGHLLWEGAPLCVPGASVATVCAAEHVIDDPLERGDIARRTGALAVDMESGVLAASGRLVGSVRAIADGPEREIGGLAYAATEAGGVRWSIVLKSFLTEPRRAINSARAARRALQSLERAACALAGGAQTCRNAS